MSKRLFAGLLAGALMSPQPSLSADTSDGLRLPPIAYAETIPWLTKGSPAKAPSYLGLLLAPKTSSSGWTDFAAAPVTSRTWQSSQMATDSTVSTE